MILAMQFQSTQPKRAATHIVIKYIPRIKISIHAAQEGCDNKHCQSNPRIRLDFNPRSPRGLRLKIQFIAEHTNCISIHAAQEGCDIYNPCPPSVLCISIHAAQEGCDSCCCTRTHVSIYFNPRSPRGLRLRTAEECEAALPISIHAAQEGCDYFSSASIPAPAKISIHAAQEGCDSVFIRKIPWQAYFNPRSPRGLRLRRISLA